SGANGLPAGLSATWAGNVITISGTPTQAGTFNYSIPLTGGCATLFAEGTITVNPATSISSESLAAQSICDGQNFSSISINAAGTGTLVYQWYSNTDPNTTGGTPVGSSLPTYTPSAAAIGTLYYYVEVSSDCGPVAVSNVSGTFTVDPITSITIHPDPTGEVECFGDGFFSSISVSAIGGGLTYQWYSNSVQSNSGGISITGANSPSFTPPSTPVGSAFYYAVVTGNCGVETSTVSGEYIVTPPVTNITQDPSNIPQTVCLGDTFSSLSVLAIGEGPVTYKWYRNTSASNSGGTLIPGETNPNFTPTASTVGITYYYATASSDCGTVPTEVSGAFTVTPLTEIETENLGGQVICDGDSFAPISVDAIGTSTITYQWFSAATSTNLGGTLIPSGTNSSFTPPATAPGTTTYYYVEVSSECGSDVVSNPSGAFSVSLDNTASAPSSDPTLCINTALTNITHTTTGATGIGAATGLPAGVTANWAANTITISGTPSASGTFNYSIPLSGGCGAVNATGTITVTPDNTVSAPTSSPTLCINTALTNITHTTTGATGIGAATGLPAGVTANWAANTITISGTPSASGTFNYSIPLSGGCGAVNATGTITVTANNTAAAPSSDPALCINSPLTNITIATTGAIGISNDGENTGVNGLPAGVSATWSGGVITISGTPTESGTFNYSIPLTGGCGAVNATGTITVNPLATIGATSVAYPSVCISSPVLAPFTQSTTGVTGIGTPTGLPPGISANFDSGTGVITFSGTATTTGLYSYSIPLTGNCINGLQATGTIDVTPDYVLTSVSSVSATSIGGTASITINGDPAILSNGIYEVEYQIAQGSGSFYPFGPVTVSVINGRGSFSTIPITSVEDTYVVQILSIKKSTDVCTITFPDPPTTYFGVCSAVYDSNSTFFVPANVYSITIEVYGAGGGGDNGGAGGGAYSIRENIPVTPGESLGVIVGNGGTKNGTGGVTYVTRDSNIADQLGNSLVYANGGNGGSSGTGGTYDPRFSGANGSNASGDIGGNGGGSLGGDGGASKENGRSPGGGGGAWSGGNGVGGDGLVVVSYSCPDADDTDCIKIIDDGSKSGYTVIEYTCDDIWTAPEGLAEFTVYVGSGGGGGGGGEGSGGGGSGSLISQTFTTSNPYGFPAGTNFTIGVGQGGNGAIAIDLPGENGEESTFTGTVDGNAINITVLGGGGGGSSQQNPGGNGASGGGGGASPDPAKSEGYGGTPVSITYTGSNVIVYQGNAGGDGDYSEPQNSV
ncbi:beta strand repeat-containing protein, partial [Flavihumibacter sp.]|uniref:beta strand repeat-containing protein n=1 Tax=Flavihumibacter sp. TaxID=1913981 RepID=UPI003FA60CF4